MSIDGRGSSLSRRAQDRISSLVSQNERLTERVAVLENLVQGVSDDRDSYAERCDELERDAVIAEADRVSLLAEIRETTGEKERARNTAVALENQLAEVADQLADTERIYEAEYYKTGNPTDKAGLSAVQDCTTSFDVATDVVLGDLCEDVTGRANA